MRRACTIGLSSCGGCGKEGEDLPRFADVVLEKCDNGEDDNEDGWTDCQQPSCQLDPACVFEPADPATSAPARGNAVSNFAESVAFLWSGDNPVVREVDVDALDLNRVAVVRALVTDSAGEPVGGVRAHIAGRPELGYTFSRSDGAIDLVVNGGETVRVRVGGGTELTVDRAVLATPLTYSWADSIVVTVVAGSAATVDAAKGGLAAGTQVSDDAGERTARIWFQPDTVVTIHMPDGQKGTVDTADVRLTEYTVGDSGPSAMPGELPADTGYTYALELSVDAARAAGADGVTFSKPAFLYVENFLGFEAGTTVPSGVYGRDVQEWTTSANGEVLRRTSKGVDGDVRERLGITKAELDVIKEQFDEGELFWRVPVSHFSPYDLNWPFDFPPDAVAPDDIPDPLPLPEPPQCVVDGSVIECQNQVMSKRVRLPGTPYDLVYRSDRVAGAGSRFSMPLTSDSPPESLVKVVVVVDFAGRKTVDEFEPAPNLDYSFEWDGLDGYGRDVSGRWPITLRVGYYYNVTYTEPPASQEAFNQRGGDPLRDGVQIMPIWSTYRGDFGAFDSLRAHGLGGWSLDGLHAYDGAQTTLYPAAAPERTSRGVGRVLQTVDTFANSAGGVAPREHVPSSAQLAIAPDDSLYVQVLAEGNSYVLRRSPDGTLEHVAGVLDQSACVGGCGKDGPATGALFRSSALTVDASGIPYLVIDQCTYAVREGTLDEVECHSDNDRPDGSAEMPNVIASAAIGADGQLYLAGNSRVVEVFPNGFVRDLTGCEVDDCEVPSILPQDPREVTLFGEFLAMSPAGELHIGQRTDGVVVKLDRTGKLRLVTAIDEELELRGMSFGNDGTLYAYFLNGTDSEIRRLVGDTWQWVAGARAADIDLESDNLLGFLLDQGEPVDAGSVLILPIGNPTADSAGTVYLPSMRPGEGETSDAALVPIVQQVTSVFPAQTLGRDETLVSSRAGDRLFRFDAYGRQVQTVDSLSFAPLRTFQRDEDGLVTAVTDPFGNVTTITREAGMLASIEGPWGHRTEFATDADGYIESITLPGGGRYRATSGYRGLLTEWLDPRDEVSSYQYDSVGRLERAEEPGGEWKQLTRLAGGGVEVTTNTGGAIRVGEPGASAAETVYTDKAGLQWRTRRVRNQIVETTQPDGMTTRMVYRSDPRFGGQAQYVGERTTTTPSGLSQTIKTVRKFELDDPSDLTTVRTFTETRTIGDLVSTVVWDVAAGRVTTTSPAGRVAVVEVDEFGRTTSIQRGDQPKVEFSFDSMGRLASVKRGSDEATASYGSDGTLASVASASLTLNYSSDANGALSQLEDGVATHLVGRDSRGDITQLTLGDQLLSYNMEYSPNRLVSAIVTPEGDRRELDWSEASRLAQLTLPSSRQASYSYDDAGRIVGIDTEDGEYGWQWDFETGLLAAGSSPTTETRLSYDGSLITSRGYTVGGREFEVSRQFDDDFRLVQQEVGGAAVGIAYDADGFVTSAGPVEIEYRADGLLAETVTVGGVTSEFTSTSTGGTAVYQHGGDVLFAEDFTLADGRVNSVTTEVEGVNETQAFTYDPVGRLLTVEGNHAVTFAYDAAGQRTQGYNGAVSYLDGRTASVGSSTYSWDSDGFLSGIDDGVAPIALEHDTFGQLSRVTVGGEVLEYHYSLRGHRVARLVDGAVDTVWVYDDTSRPVAEFEADGTLRSRFIYATNSLVPDSMEQGGRMYRIIRDRRYSVRLVVDAQTGQVAQRLDYNVLGEVVADSNPGFQPFGFAGGLYEPTTGLTHMGKRVYDARSGRWTTPDSSGLQDGGYSLYTYVGGDPVNYVDPGGETWLVVLLPPAALLLKLALQAPGIIRRAGEGAQNTYWGLGDQAGPQSALRHCTGQCEFSKEFGTTLAWFAGWYHEAPIDLPSAGQSKNTYDDPDWGVDRLSDEIANQCGREIAVEKPEADCLAECNRAIETGELTIPHSSHWQNSGNPAERARRGIRLSPM